MSHKYEAFISYSEQDAAWASALAEELKGHYIRVWCAKTDPRDYASPASRAYAAFRQSKCFVPLVSKSSIDSPLINIPLGAAMVLGKRILPVISEDVSLQLDQLPSRVGTHVQKMSTPLLMEDTKNTAAMVRFSCQ
jgi:hypothetical protein